MGPLKNFILILFIIYLIITFVYASIFWTSAIGIFATIIIGFLIFGLLYNLPNTPIPQGGWLTSFASNLQHIGHAFVARVPQSAKIFAIKLWNLLKMMGMTLLGIFVLVLFVGFGVYVFNMATNNNAIFKTVTYAVNILIFLGILALIYHFTTARDSITSKSILLIFDIIFYIPCLLIDFVKYIHNQYNISTRFEWTILLAEALLISLYFLLPKLYNFVMTHEGQLLLNDPVYTNKVTSLDIDSSMAVQDPNRPLNSSKVNVGGQYNYNYAISCWIYINPQPPSTSVAYENYTSLLSYGGKPTISYKGLTNTLQITMRRDLGDNPVVVYKNTDLPLQKWNHFVINYNSGTLDVFMNDKLVSSVSEIIPYMKHETMQIGTANGVHGGICNVMYFPSVLSATQISWLYNSTKFKNPPII